MGITMKREIVRFVGSLKENVRIGTIGPSFQSTGISHLFESCQRNILRTFAYTPEYEGGGYSLFDKLYRLCR
jgi:hypothetical protein